MSVGLNRPSMDEMFTICCVYTFRLLDCILLTALDALMISAVSRVSRFGLALFTLELATLFHHGLEFPRFSTSNQSMSDSWEVRRRSVFLVEFERRGLLLSPRQSNAVEQCSSSDRSFLITFCFVSRSKNKTHELDFNL